MRTTATKSARVYSGNLLILENAMRVAGMTNDFGNVDIPLRSFLPERVKKSAYRKELLAGEWVENTSTLRALEDSRRLYPDEWSDDLEVFTSKSQVRTWYLIGRCYGFTFPDDTARCASYIDELYELISTSDYTLSTNLKSAFTYGLVQGRKDKQTRNYYQKQERLTALALSNHPVFGDDE
jgi:hypothetical protein